MEDQVVCEQASAVVDDEDDEVDLRLNMTRSALFRLFPSASFLVAHLGLNPDPNPNPNP